MGSVYKRKDSAVWWIAYLDASGKRRLFSSKTTNKAEAEALLRTIERRIAAEKAAGVTPDAPLTVRRYAQTWVEDRRARGIASADEDEDRLEHALPVIGDLLLKDVTRRQVRDLMRGLSKAGKLAPRTQLHVYGALRVMFNDAVVEELVPFSPCTLKAKRGELPKKRDKDPTWRHQAVYQRHEVELLISDLRVPEHRRVLYALLFLGGMRIGEAVARRWRDYDRMVAPLGKLLVGTTYDLKRKRLKESTKTGFERQVPVHPTLAKVLGEWRLSGWTRYCRRPLTADDLIVPSPLAVTRYMSATSALKRLHEDLQRLGLRSRRTHDTRRTFVSLGIADGGRKEVLHWISHGPADDGEAFDDYLTLPWPTLCDEVRRINIRLRQEGEVVPLPARYGTATEDSNS